MFNIIYIFFCDCKTNAMPVWMIRRKTHPGRSKQHPGRSEQHPGRSNQHPGRSNQHPGRSKQHPDRSKQHFGVTPGEVTGLNPRVQPWGSVG